VRLDDRFSCVYTLRFNGELDDGIDASKYFDVFLREARDDFERDDKTLAAAEGEASGRHQKSLEKR
jgi:hypothetical protein